MGHGAPLLNINCTLELALAGKVPEPGWLCDLDLTHTPARGTAPQASRNYGINVF